MILNIISELVQRFFSKVNTKTALSLGYAGIILCVLVSCQQFLFAANFEYEVPIEHVAQVTNIFPGDVISNGWSAVDTTYSQDAHEDSLYNFFSNQNSAKVSLFEIQSTPPISVDGNSTEAIPPIGTPITDSNESTPISDGAESQSDELQAPPPTEDDVEGVGDDQEGVLTEPAVEQTESEPTEPVSSEEGEQLSSAVFQIVRGAYAFAASMFSSSTDEVSPVEDESTLAPREEVITESAEEVVAEDVGEENTLEETPVEISTSSPVSNAAEGTLDEVLITPSDNESTDERIGTTTEEELVPVQKSLCGDVECHTHVLEFSNFSVGDGFDEQHILNMQLRMSLAARPNPHNDPLREILHIEYFYDDAWIEGGDLQIDDEISNAMNGGYFLFAFPIYTEWEQMESIRVRLTYESDNEHLADIYVDSMWLEVESIHKDALKEQPVQVSQNVDEEQELRRAAPEGYTFEFLENKEEFGFHEKPEFRFRPGREKGGILSRIGDGIRNFLGFGREEVPLRMRIVGDEFKNIARVVEDNGEFKILMERPRHFKPGKHLLTVEIIDGDSSFFIDQEFTWGVLALNVDKSIYSENEEAYLQMGVLDDRGHTICNAKLDIEITDPRGNIDYLSTDTGSIAYGEECVGDTYTTSPDYSSRYTTRGLGTYSVKLTATTENGVHSITDSFQVLESVAFDVQRTGPTRIYPPAPYPVSLTITALEDYTGEVIELVPQGFQVFESHETPPIPFRTHEIGDIKQLIWNVSLLAGESVTLEYLFDAPDVSPEFYLLGPLNIGSFAEIREWQIASDAPDPAKIVQSVLGGVVDGTTYPATFSSTPTMGNTIIMVAMHRDNAVSFNTPTDFTLASYSDSANAIDIGIWYKVVDTASTTFSAVKNGGGNESGRIMLFEVEGLNTADLLDVVASNDQTGGTSLTAYTGATATSTQYGFALAATGWGDNDFGDPTTSNWSSDSVNPYTQLSWSEWATGNDGGLGIASANINTADTQGATLTLTSGGNEIRNSTIAVFNLVPQVVTVSSLGNQTTPLLIDTQNNYVGGMFTFTTNTGSSTITNINLTETGTTDAQNDLSNIRMYYDLDTSAPYDCVGLTYDGNEAQYGATSTSFSATNGTSTFAGSLSVATTSAVCMYTVLTVDASAGNGDTLELEIVNPSTNVTVNSGTVSPGTSVSISDTSVLSVGYVPSTPTLTETPAFENMRATTTLPTLGGFVSTDDDGDLIEYEIIIDDDFDLTSPATTTRSSNFPNDLGWSSTTFASGATTTYTIQAADALEVGTTYWWAARARDPFNTNEWSATSTPRSITIGSAITVPEWYQTTEEQFQLNTFSDTATTTNGGVVVTGDASQSFFWLDEPVDVSPGTAGSWQTVDVAAYVPQGATGVILHWDASNTGGADRDLGFRHGDSTDNRVTAIEVEKHDWAFAGLNSSRQFDAYVEVNTMDVYLVGYTMDGVTFFTNSSNKTLTSNSTWQDISIAADTGSNTAIGAIVEVVHVTNSDTWGIRKNGSSDNRTIAYGRYHNWAIIGVDENEVFEGWANDITDTTFHVIGYVTENATFLTNGATTTPTLNAGWFDIDITDYLLGVDDPAGAFIEVYGANQSGDTYSLRGNDSTTTEGAINEQHKRKAWGIIPVDDDDIYEAQMTGADAGTMHLIGYGTKNRRGTVLSTPVDFDWVQNQTDWGEITWNVTEPSGSDTYLQVYYTSTTSCDSRIPDSVLSGNSTGFTATSSPLNITSLSTTTYNEICLRMTLDQGLASSSPSLDSWNISWELKPIFEQTAFWWFANAASATPTDTWPAGATGFELGENEVMETDSSTKFGDVLRLRMGAEVTSVAASGYSFKLQYAAGDICSAELAWVDVGAIGSSTALWRGYNNTGVNDGATLPTAKLSGTDVLETYEEENNSSVIPNTINVNQEGEWDWVLENRAEPSTAYCFRMIGSDGTPFSTYTNYPQVVTNQSPSITSIITPFDNEKLASTSVWFEFIGVDPEGEELDYQIQISTSTAFDTVIVDTNSEVNLDDFINIIVPADKSPFNDSQTIRYIMTASLTDGNTYWWRVRVKDTNGSATYGDWATMRSFTVDTGVSISTWFQTSEEQFDTDVLEGTDATASDNVTFASGSTTGTTTSSAIDFDDATVGNAWGEFSFTETGSANNILYHIEYNNGSSWVLIPDSALPGNAAGYDTSPVDLIDLDTETYNQIRIRANFLSGSPTLNDWTIEWGLRVSVPTHLLLFDNEKVGTTTPTFTFFTTDPQGDDLEYEISWSTDNTFATGSTTVNSSSSVGFTNITNGGNFNPFDSGDTISYEMQSALTNGTTYWWRTRAKDPDAGNSYSFWSEPWSFTVDILATTSTWFQTTDEQFTTDTLSSLEVSSDSVSTIVADVFTYNFSGVTSPSATNVARDFEVDVDDPTDPPTVNAINTLTNTGTNLGTPNLRTGIAGYASDAEADNTQYTAIATSDNSRWQITDPGAGDNAVFWASFHIDEDVNDIAEITVLLEGYQAAATDVAWLGIWRPGAGTPYWQDLSHSQRTGDFNYTGTITSDIDEYLDENNDIHIIFFNEDDSDSLFVDYVEVEITTETADAGTLTGTPIDFNDGSGPAWGQLYWTDSEPGLSSLTYQLQYLTGGGTWALIPDGALGGNAAGFTTDPINLRLLDTTTYNEIRVIGNFDCNLGSCPTLSDWTIEWSRGFTVSGTAFEYDGVSSTTSGTVAVAVNGTVQIGKTGSISNGYWTIENVTFFEDDVVTVFVSSATDSDEAVGVTVYDGTPDITGMRLQKRHLTIGSDDAAVVTNSDLSQYDFTTSGDDVFFDVVNSGSGDDLAMCADTNCSDAGIVVLQNNSYAPGSGADIVTHDFVNSGTFTSGSNSMRVSGSWDNNATSTLTGSTVIFTATSTTESIDSTGAVVSAFNNVTLGETSGAATWNLSSALDVDGNLQVTYGTVSRGTQQMSVAGNLTTGAAGYFVGMGTTTIDGTGISTWTDSNATKQNIGRVLVDGTSKTLLLGSNVVAQSMTIGGNDTLDASVQNRTITIYENWLNNNTFTPRSGTVVFAATSTNWSIGNNASSFYNLSFTGAGGSWSFQTANVTISNDLTIATGTVTLPTGTTTIAGSFTSVGGTFGHNNGLINFTSAAAETIAASGTVFTNAFNDLRFSGSGSWTFLDTHATTSNDIRISAGTVTMPNNTMSIGGSFYNTAGSFGHNNGTLKFTSAATEFIDTNASFNNLLFSGSGDWSFIDSTVTALGDVIVEGGVVTFPTVSFNIGGSLTNAALIAHNNASVLFNSTDSGETIDLGASALHTMIFNSSTGGWTIGTHATATNNVTLTALSSFTLSSGFVLSVGGTFTNSVGGASTTWTGSTLSLESGAYSMNAKTNTGDSYGTLQIKANTDIQMWNSTSTIYTIDPSGSLYSSDHNGVDGELYIFGNYVRSSGTEYWSYATDFDGTSLGGASRQVAVKFDSGASADFTNSTLSIVGTSTASTSIGNQGSGTYTVSVTNGTTTMNYYDFTDLGSTGVTIEGTPVVTSLSDGAFTPSVNAGTALTISSTTIDANPALQIFRVDFSTTTAIAASNVTQTDGTPASYWWFRQSTGNIGGEAFDNDTGDPGSIRWDDSSLVITVEGTVYDDDEINPLGAPTCGAGTPVRVVVEGGATYNGACDGSGNYTIPGVVVVGDPTLTVFLNGAAGGERAVTVTKTPTADILDLDLIVNRVVVRHEDVSPMTIADMASYDSSDDSDIAFTAATGTPDSLIVSADTELHIYATSTFSPGGTVTLTSGGTGNTFDGSLHIDNAATFTGAGTTTYSVGGTFSQDIGASFIPASSTVLMTATTSGKAITPAAGETVAFNELQFTGVGGSWNINGDISASDDIYVATGTVTGTGNITVTEGSLYGNGLLSLGSGTTTLYGSNTLGGTESWTFYNLSLGDGVVVGTTTPAGTATTTVDGTLRINVGHFLDAGASTWNLGGTGSVFVENGTFLEDASTLRYSGTGATNILSTDYYRLILDADAGSPTYTATGLGIEVFDDLYVGGTGTTTVNFTTHDTALNVDGDMHIRALGTFIASNSGVFTLAGNYENDGTFTSSDGTITFDGAGGITIAAGQSTFGSVSINGAGTVTVTENATATSAFTLTNTAGFTVSSGQTLAVGGVFTNTLGGGATTWTGSTLHLYGGGNYAINASTTNDSYEVLSIAANTQIRMWNSAAATYSLSGTGSLYSQDHAAVDGDLYIFGAYQKSAGTDYWNYAQDFDGTLLSGTERKVDVYIANGGSVLYSAGGLSVLGDPSASTTIQNQGSGSYSFRIGGTASTSMVYYELRNLNSSGLTFSGTPTVGTLSYGDFLVEAASGTAITIGGSAINQNPAKTFTHNIFATATPIIARNVTATGTAVSSWRFTNSTGNIEGEDFDVDPGGDPGYIVWDDSAGEITISGNVYSDEGSSVSTVCDGSTNRIRLVVDGLSATSTSCNGDGAGGGTGFYSISGINFSSSTSMVVYIDNMAQNGANVTVNPVSNINNMHIYENRVIVRHENTDPISIEDMAVYDSSDDPADIPFTATLGSPDSLTLPADTKLIVWNSKEFEPGGNVTLSGGGAGAAYDGTLELYTNAVFDATGGESHSIGGSFVSGSGATFDEDTSTVTFTTSGAARTIDTNDAPFYNLVFNGSGSWTISNSELDIGNDFTITQGGVTLPTGTTTVTGSFLNNGGSFIQNGGHFIFDGSTAESIRVGGSDFGTTTFIGTGSWSYLDQNATTTGNFTILSGTVTAPSGVLAIGQNFNTIGSFVHNSDTLRFTSASTTAGITASSSDLHSVNVDSSGSYTFTDTDVALLGSLTIESGTVNLATGTLSIGGSLQNVGGSFNHGSGTVLFNSADTGETVRTGGSNFYNVVFGSAGGWTLQDSATSSGNFSITGATVFNVGTNTITVLGVFTNTVGGSATDWGSSTLRILTSTSYTINSNLAGGDEYNMVYIGPNTDLRAWNSRATTTIVDGSSSLYSQDHGGVNGALYIYGDYLRTTGADYWSYATDFDGTSLVGGSERTAMVRFADNATSTFTDGTLAIVGSSAATTSIASQGSGTYAFLMQGGTLNAQNYSFRNLNADGLTLHGLTTITSLSNGDYELAVPSGSLITLSSTTLNHNASLVISGVRFATTTAISGTNVELVGTTLSAWTFTDHRGNLAGESFDSDGGDACGSLRWEDSVCLLTQQSGYRWRNDDGGEGVPNSEWFDTDWDKRKRVTVTNADPVSYENAVIELTIPYDSDMQIDFDDLRFTDDDGTTELSYFIETYTASTDALVWVNVPLLATSTETDIYMYYGNGLADDDSNGTSTFIMFDGFEDGNITEYSGDTGEFTVDGTAAYERTYRLEASDPGGGQTIAGGMYNNSYTVSQGERIRFLQYIDATAVGDESCMTFGTQSQTLNYGVCLELFGVDRMSLVRNVLHRDTSGTVLASTTVAYSTGWYEIEIDWDIDDSIFVSLYQDGSLVATTSASDGTYTSGGVGNTLWTFHGAWDIYSSRPLLTTEPSVAFGAEQVSGGASWIAALNSPLPGATVNETVRLRFLIENTGLSYPDKNYQIEWAPKDASPSCESVSPASYTAVPSQASCGSSPLCMEASSNFTSRASTTDILGGQGTFTYGQIVEDPDNNTDLITLEADEFTELEYALSPTSNASESSYCLRITDNGSDLDSYTNVAELEMIFAPTITALSLNGGIDISLSPGATTTVYATGTVDDLNGYQDLNFATTTIFRSGVGEACTADTNNCYISTAPLCSFQNCADTSCEISCTADIYYHADPTDAGTYGGETWRAYLVIEDQGGALATATAPSIDLQTLRAIAVDSTIDYGTLSVNSDTGAYNATTTVQNIGNDNIDLSIAGTDLSDGGSSLIPVNEQIFATTTFSYSSCVICSTLATTTTNIEVDLVKPASTTPAITDQVFWGISIPFGVAGTPHQGTNIFYTIGD